MATSVRERRGGARAGATVLLVAVAGELTSGAITAPPMVGRALPE